MLGELNTTTVSCRTLECKLDRGMEVAKKEMAKSKTYRDRVRSGEIAAIDVDKSKLFTNPFSHIFSSN